MDRSGENAVLIPPITRHDEANSRLSTAVESETSSLPSDVVPVLKSPDSPRPSSCPPGPPCDTVMPQEKRSNSTNDLATTRERSASETHTDDVPVLETDELKVPIVGYEIMEHRTKFTVFKLHVDRSPHDNWFVFRRYTDFVRLNDQLKELFPTFRLALPPKKWFGNNYDLLFLEDRQLGLQAFISNITGHKDIVKTMCVREFFCLDDPPGPYDSLEESRALCESLEEDVYHLRHEVNSKDKVIRNLTEEVSSLRAENEQLLKSLRGENGSSSCRRSSPVSESSLAECEYPSATEADQSHTTNGDSDKSRKRSMSRDIMEELMVINLKRTYIVRFSNNINEYSWTIE